MEGNISELLNFLMFLGTILACLYARRSWKEVLRANIIAVHSNRMDVYKGLRELRYTIQSKSLGVEIRDIAPFFQLFDEARFYFSNTITSHKLREYFEICFSLAECASKLSRPNLTDNVIRSLHDEQDDLSNREQKLFKEASKMTEDEIYGTTKYVFE